MCLGLSIFGTCRQYVQGCIITSDASNTAPCDYAYSVGAVGVVVQAACLPVQVRSPLMQARWGADRGGREHLRRAAVVCNLPTPGLVWCIRILGGRRPGPAQPSPALGQQQGCHSGRAELLLQHAAFSAGRARKVPKALLPALTALRLRKLPESSSDVQRIGPPPRHFTLSC